MFKYGVWIFSLVTFSEPASFLFKDNPLYSRLCDVGAVVENECNKCICTLDHVYECFPKEKQCKSPVRDTPLCQPSTIYVLNDTICICNESGRWPHRQCDSLFKSLASFEPNRHCEPNSYFVNDCNVCRCGSDGQLDKSHCTKNKCNKPQHKPNNPKARRFAAHNDVYGKCEVETWYSLAPCQFCFCINANKLVCNTGNNYAQKLELGAYNLSICGKELIREAMELMPDSQKYLRFGLDAVKNTVEITTSGVIELNDQVIASNIDDEPQGEIKVNHEDILKEELPEYTYYNNSDEYESETEEEKPFVKLIETEGTPSTQLLHDEKNEEEATPIKESEHESESEDEMGVEIETPLITPTENIVEDNIIISTPEPDHHFNLKEALKFSLPIVLDKVFKMALQKSMVSVETNTKCKPGAATFTDCNVCFCVDDHKLLCTNNTCKVKSL